MEGFVRRETSVLGDWVYMGGTRYKYKYNVYSRCTVGEIGKNVARWPAASRRLNAENTE